MSQIPDSRTISLKLSEALSDIGVTEEMMLKRRNTFILMETIDTTILRLLGKNVISYNFGSQSEGSTTMDLDSDIDTLFCYHDFNVIHGLGERKPEMLNLLMIQDDATSPGYCLLERLPFNDRLITFSPIDVVRLDDKHFITDEKGRMLMKNTYFNDLVVRYDGRNGPAHVLQGNPHCNDEDNVIAWHCKSWPLKIRSCSGRWPSEEVKRQCETTGFFLVPVGSKSGQNEELEWRISTSQAERHLMFSLNITQMRCYILMKMILKTFINPHCSGVISSYMLKNVLFNCIQNTSQSEWEDSHLFECLRHCLSVLQTYVMQENCPHFIIAENNLMGGKITSSAKHQLFVILLSLMQDSHGLFLMKIHTDYLGGIFHLKLFPNVMHRLIHYPLPPDLIHFLNSKNLIQCLISAQLLRHIAAQISIRHMYYLHFVMDSENETDFSRAIAFRLVRQYGSKALTRLERSAYTVFLPFFCSSLASTIASNDLGRNKPISPAAKAWFSAGLDSDVSSGRLKLASALYCSGDIYRTECILQSIEHKYDTKTVETICKCCKHPVKHLRQGLEDKSNTGNEELVKYITSFCVRFLRCERNCVPHELQYEMYRSTQEDMLHRYKPDAYWMDWAAVDSLPYLYFLQYKIYVQRVLKKFITTLDTEPNIRRRETALNLLGQCMEQEHRYKDALNYYIRSLEIRERNNAAKIHICRLLSVLINRRVAEK